MARLTAIAALKKLRQENPNIILLYGTEKMLEKEVVNKYLVINDIDDNNSFNYSRSSCTAIEDDLLNTMLMPPMFAAARVIVVTDFEKVWTNSSLRKSWSEGLAKLPKTTKLLLLDAGKPDKRQKVYKAIDKLGFIVECIELKTGELKKWISREFKKEGKQADPQTIEYLISLVGRSMLELLNEINKLIAYKAEDTNITAEDIDLLVAAAVESGIFACVDAIGQRDIPKAYRELKLLQATGEPPLRILVMIIRQIRLIIRAKLLQERGYTKYSLMKELKVPEFVLKKLYQQTVNFSVNELKDLLLSLNKIEENIKTGKINPKLALELWVIGHTEAVK